MSLRWIRKLIFYILKKLSENKASAQSLLQNSNVNDCPVGWGRRIHRLHLRREVTLPTNMCPEYDTIQSDGQGTVMLELWGIRSNPSFPLLPGPLRPEVLGPNRALSIG